MPITIWLKIKAEDRKVVTNNMWKFIKTIFKNMSKSEELKFLERSTDLVDLENRMKRISRGTAPFQLQTNYNLERRW